MSDLLPVFHIAERFKSVQGEGIYAGTPMAFIRFVGCSVGKRVCAACDTDFDKPYTWKNGGVFSADQLLEWAKPFHHVCLTGGEPFDNNLEDIFAVMSDNDIMVHVETSGTVAIPEYPTFLKPHICVSPKPGWKPEAIAVADEIKVIVPGLGPGDGWPELAEALTWAAAGKLVYIQPRNLRDEIDFKNLQMVLAVLQEHPELRLSTQLHKFLHVS